MSITGILNLIGINKNEKDKRGNKIKVIISAERSKELQESHVIEKYNEVMKRFAIYYSVRNQHTVRQAKLSDIEVIECFAKELITEKNIYEAVMSKVKNSYLSFKNKMVSGL